MLETVFNFILIIISVIALIVMIFMGLSFIIGAMKDIDRMEEEVNERNKEEDM